MASVTIQRCETCKHRSKYTTDAEISGLYECMKINQSDSATQSDIAAAVANPIGYHGCNAFLAVKPEFGCVLWESED